MRGVPEGEGTFTYANPDPKNMRQYAGSWLGGKHHGYGKAFYANEDIYEGEFVNGNREGKGTYVFNRHYKYQG